LGLTLLLLASPLLLTTFFLNKMQRDPLLLQTNPALIAAETVDKTDHENVFIQADADIAENKGAPYANGQVFNVLLGGIDYGGGDGQSYGRSDAMMLISFNTATKTITTVSISRATYAALNGHPNGRLNLAHAYGGPAAMARAVEQNYQLRIDGYMTVDFDGFSRIIDLVGGVDLPIAAGEEFEALKDSCRLDHGPGVYNFNGEQALLYARLRWIDSDRDRTQRQRNIIEALARKAVTLSPGQIGSAVSAMLPFVTTDLSSVRLMSLARYLGYTRREAIIPKTPMRLTLVDESEVIILNWKEVRKDVRELLYTNIPVV
jgi:LCP family protein required for cell wall assembly